ncbi:MAG: hypothetical protein DMF06_01035 [Verrucomicrobia bacterium]|nr:MAG: hypothetical protein DMF06_01035 [Verrucomicrobiota bacterium]
MAAAALRKDRRLIEPREAKPFTLLIFIVPLVLPRQPRNAKRFYATDTEAACPPLDGLAVARGEAFYAALPVLRQRQERGCCRRAIELRHLVTRHFYRVRPVAPSHHRHRDEEQNHEQDALLQIESRKGSGMERDRDTFTEPFR